MAVRQGIRTILSAAGDRIVMLHLNGFGWLARPQHLRPRRRDMRVGRRRRRTHAGRARLHLERPGSAQDERTWVDVYLQVFHDLIFDASHFGTI